MKNNTKEEMSVQRGMGWALTVAKILAVVFLIILAAITPFAVIAGVIGIAKAAFDSIYRLGIFHIAPHLAPEFREVFKASVPVTAWVTTGAPFVLTAVLVIGNKVLSNTAKGIMVLFLVLGILELTLLYFYEQALTVGVAAIPVELVNLGAFIYSGIGGFNLLPALLVPVVSFTAAHNKHATMKDAIGAIFNTILHAVLFVVGVAAEFYFGTRIGLPVIYAVVAALLVGLGYIYANIKLGGAHERGDHYDIKVWNNVNVFLSLYLGIVGAMAAAELATANKDVVPEAVRFIGIRLNFFVQLILLAVLAYIDRKTNQIDDLNGDGKDDKTGQVIGVRLPARVSAVVDALNGKTQAKQLPQPTMVMNQTQRDNTNWDEVERKLEAGIRKRKLDEVKAGHNARQQIEKPYDITGTWKMAEEPPSILNKEDDSPKS
jgi:hypothetical protein